MTTPEYENLDFDKGSQCQPFIVDFKDLVSIGSEWLFHMQLYQFWNSGIEAYSCYKMLDIKFWNKGFNWG